MLITNLVSVEDNGVVTTQFKSENHKIKIVFPLENLISFTYGITDASEDEVRFVKRWLNDITKAYITDKFSVVDQILNRV